MLKSTKDPLKWAVVECHHCGKRFERTLWQLKRYKHNYCSSRCSLASKDNKVPRKKDPKKWTKRDCSCCGKKFELAASRVAQNKTGFFFCCRQCYLLGRSLAHPKDPSKFANHNCYMCGKEVEVLISQKGMYTKHYCSQECFKQGSAEHLKKIVRKKKPQQYCIICKKPRSRYSKKYCSVQCIAEHRYQMVVDNWLTGKDPGYNKAKLLKQSIRRYLLKQANNACQLCGWNKCHPVNGLPVLQVHHIDGDWRNNRPENLQVLCPNCHALTPNNGYLNVGNGRSLV
jgi:hypothetical protein